MSRTLFKIAAWAICSPAIAFSQADGTICHASPQETRKQLPWAGNAGEIQWSANLADCKVDAGGLPWITVSVLPPISGNVSLRVLRYSVDTNFSPLKREGKIQVGDSSITLEQAGGPAPGMAYSPSRLEFTITPAKNAPPEASKSLFVGSEEPLLFTATPAPSAPWVRVKDTDSIAPRTQRSFQVTVSAAGKDPGVYQTTIQIDAPGAANAKETVPVTMTVEKAK